MAFHHPRTAADRSSGASLAIVCIAAIATMALGAYLKRAKPESGHGGNLAPTVSRLDLRMVTSGKGQAEVPTSPKALTWMQLELWGDGQPIHYRPIQFKRKAVDATGKPIAIEQIWHDGYLYLFLRGGFRKSTGPIKVTLAFQGKTTFEKTLPPFPPVKRILSADDAQVPKGYRAEVVRIPNVDKQTHLGLLLKADQIAPNEALAVQRLTTSFSDSEPSNQPWFSDFGTYRDSAPVPLEVAYPEDVDAARIRLTRFRAKPETNVLEFKLNYRGTDSQTRQFALVPQLIPWAGGCYLTMSRFNRSLSLPASGLLPITLVVNSLGVHANSRLKLLSPARIHGIPINVVNRMRTPISPVEDNTHAIGNLTPEPGEMVTIRVEAEVGIYSPVKSTDFSLPVNAKKARTVVPPRESHFQYNDPAWLQFRSGQPFR